MAVSHIYTRLTQDYSKLSKLPSRFYEIFSYKQQLMTARVHFLYVQYKIPFNLRPSMMLPAGGGIFTIIFLVWIGVKGSMIVWYTYTYWINVYEYYMYTYSR